MRKIILLILGAILLTNLVCATDVAYIVTQNSEIKQEFIGSINNLGLSYNIIYYNQVSSTNFSKYRMILLNNDYFPNWDQIPVNDVPGLIVNGRNIQDWGWTRRVTTASHSEPINVNISGCTNEKICGNLSGNIQVYDSSSAQIYYLDKIDIYGGLEIIASNIYDNEDAVIALAKAGTTLTRLGYPDTVINANSIFFGITESEFWTDETIELFENSLLWLLGESTFDIEIKEGQNLISFPLIINYTPTQLKSENPNISSIKEYNNNNFVEATTLENNKGYFIEASSDFILTTTGDEPRNTQNVLLSQGMNLIGISSLSNIILNDLPDEIIEVAKRKDDGVYDISTKYDSNWFNSFELEPGKGYWFKIEIDEVTWSYSP